MTSSIFAPQLEKMSSQQFKSIQELAEELNQYLAAIAEGEGNVDRLQEMVDHARELYERLVVMRHKAFEEITEPEAEEPGTKVIADEEVAEPEEEPHEVASDEPIQFSIGIEDSSEPEESQPETEEETNDEEEKEEESDSFSIGVGVSMEPQSLNLDLDEGVLRAPGDPEPEPKPEEAPAVPENQTSLIDAIEEISEESLAEKYESQNDSESLVEKLERAPINDLVSAITLNQKFQFIKELFGGDNERYLAEIESFNNMDSWESAKKVLAALDKEFGWEDGEVLEEFAELIQRRHTN